MTASVPLQGLSYLVATIQSVDGNLAYVRADQVGGRPIKVRRDFTRAKGPLPQVGEQWIIERPYGFSDWVFSLLLQGDVQTPLNVVPDTAARNAIRSPYPDMAVYQLDTWTVWRWDGSAWVISAPPPAPEPTQVACQVNLGADVALAAGDSLAQGGWNAVTNDGGYVFNLLSGAAWIQVPSTGQYQVSLKLGLSPYTGGGNALHACKVMKNGTNLSTNSIITDTKISVNIGEGTWLDAWDDVPLLAGDKLYWQVFSSGAITLKASIFNAPSRIKVRRIGPN